MDIYKEVYDFSASAGAFKGYVFPKQKLDTGKFDVWLTNLVRQYHAIPSEIRNSFQASLDRAIGRSILSLIPVLGEEHELIMKLKTMLKGEIPDSLNDFRKEIEEKAAHCKE